MFNSDRFAKFLLGITILFSVSGAILIPLVIILNIIASWK